VLHSAAGPVAASASPNAAVIRVEDLAAWRGQDVIDEHSDKLGKLDEVFFDGESDDPAFAAVKSGTLTKRLTLVPLAGASVGRDYVRVLVGKSAFKAAPSFDPEAPLSIDDEAAVYAHFGMSYAPTVQGGRRLAKR
jgi:PRC-barrel domain protein